MPFYGTGSLKYRQVCENTLPKAGIGFALASPMSRHIRNLWLLVLAILLPLATQAFAAGGDTLNNLKAELQARREFVTAIETTFAEIRREAGFGKRYLFEVSSENVETMIELAVVVGTFEGTNYGIKKLRGAPDATALSCRSLARRALTWGLTTSRVGLEALTMGYLSADKIGIKNHSPVEATPAAIREFEIALVAEKTKIHELNMQILKLEANGRGVRQ